MVQAMPGPLPEGARHRRHDDTGLSGLSSVIAIGVGLVIVALLTLVGAGTFSSSSSGGGSSVLSRSRAEQQLQLCVEGRPSVYGNPPGPSQQAACTRQLEGQIGGGPGATLPPTTTDATRPTFPGLAH